MSGFELLSVVLSSAAIVVAIVATVIYQQQVREMRRQNERLSGALRLSTTETLENGFGRITAAFLQHPELRALFFEDEAAAEFREREVDEDLMLRANALADAVLSIFASALRLSAENDIEDLPWFHSYVEDSFRNSSHLRGYAIGRRAWVDPRLVAVAERIEADLVAPD